MEPNNPYQTPSTAAVASATPSSEGFIDGGRTVPVGNGLSWIGAGWNIFTQAPLSWVVCMVIMLVIAIVLSLVPFIGGLVNYVLFALFAGGLMIGCQAQHQGRPLEIGDLFAGFKEKTTGLLTVGALYAVASVALFIIGAILFAVLLGTTGIIGALMSGDHAAIAALVGGSIIGMLIIALIVLALYVPIAMAFWFAATLVALQDVTPTAAIRMSFSACLKNFMPFLVYGVVFLVIFILAVLPFALGLLVAFPLRYASTYAAYRDIFRAN